ncbi:MAG: phosphoglycerate kinase [Deltaproteobacteria bacterium]|jgi:phosphoglycerate kinase|nr:phosphoglycerate kinase [Deltaproteobacteria bacterium]
MKQKTLKIDGLADVNLRKKKVLVRLDINSPLDPKTGKFTSLNRIQMSAPTLMHLQNEMCATVIIAHQGDSLDYQNLGPMHEHAKALGKVIRKKIDYIDDPCGPAAQEAVKKLAPGEFLMLGNLRYLAEEISTFENNVKLTPAEMAGTYLVRSLAPLVQAYVNDAFSAAHINSPSMVAFQELLPSAAGHLFFSEITALDKVMSSPARPRVFLLGGAKISDALGMLGQALDNGSADLVLTAGLTGNVFLMASGKDLGEANKKFLADRNLLEFVAEAKGHLKKHPRKILAPTDLACEEDDKRTERPVPKTSRPMGDALWLDVGEQTIREYEKVIAEAGAVFVHGPAGLYEKPLFAEGTRRLWGALEKTKAHAVAGSGDTEAAARSLIDPTRLPMVRAGGGALVRYLSGKKLPLVEAMERARERLRTKGGYKPLPDKEPA